MRITVSEPVVRNSVIIARITSDPENTYIRSGNLRVRYNGLDLHNIPKSILICPAVGALASATTAFGIPIEVPYIDDDFSHSIDNISSELTNMYPLFSRQGTTVIGNRIKNNTEKKIKDLLLYSGGVDAATSLIRNLDTIDDIVTVWGADVNVNNIYLWNKLRTILRSGQITRSFNNTIIRTNLRKFLNRKALASRFIGGSDTWWAKAQHGPSLISLTFPVAHAMGSQCIRIASSHSESYHEPWGSSPSLDNSMSCADINVIHDSYDLTRQEKISNIIAPFVKSGHNLNIAACFKKDRISSPTLNCGECEKCIRTYTGFLIAGVDPRSIGLDISQIILTNWMENVSNKTNMSENKIFMWSDIQKMARRTNPSNFFGGPSAYTDWIISHDFEKHKKSYL